MLSTRLATDNSDVGGSSSSAGGRGLSSVEAAYRLRRDGPNLLPVEPPVPLWREMAAQLFHFFAVMLWIAGGLAILAGMAQLGIAIFAVIVVNGLFAFIQEYRADRATARLRDLLPRRAAAIRDGLPVELDVTELVVGDLVLLRAGDRISADVRLAEVHGLSVDTSLLTGESVPVTPEAGDPVHAGTFVAEGEGAGQIVAVGSSTRLAGIAQLTRTVRRPRSPLARELDYLVRVIALIAASVGLLFFVVAELVGIARTDALLFAIGVTVALVPEGLLPTVTLSLAMGAQRMAASRALVRRLESVETLGSTTFICTDKTGTLTRNQMAVVEVWTPAGTARIEGSGYEPAGKVHAEGEVASAALRELALVAGRCSSGRAVLREGRWISQGDPMEAALWVLARRLDLDLEAEERARPITRRAPFDSRRRRKSVVAGDRLYLQGAPDAVLPLCNRTEGAPEALLRMAQRGLRVLAVAARTFPPMAACPTGQLETELNLLGLAGVEDAPRPGVSDAIAACRAAGIGVAMVTGDHPTTASAIAREIRLSGDEPFVVEGPDLPRDEAVLGALVDRDGIVIARVSPEDKLRIARALRKRGHVVAMTGDGVNDGPALREADIGIAMGRTGTDVAREASDLVLLDDDFSTIVAAVEQGRAAHANLRRFLTYHLTDNIAELTPFVIWALSGGRFPLALGVLQILALDIGTDLLPALALGAEPPRADALRQPPARRHLLDWPLLVRAFGVLGPVESAVAMAAFLASFVALGWRPGGIFPDAAALPAASGAAFTAVVIGQMANAFACRSSQQWPGALGWTGNRLLLLAVGVELIVLMLFLHIGWLARLLGHAPPSLAGAAVALLAFPAVLAVDAGYKWWKRGRRLLAHA